MLIKYLSALFLSSSLSAAMLLFCGTIGKSQAYVGFRTIHAVDTVWSFYRGQNHEKMDLFCLEGEYLMTSQRSFVCFGSAFVCTVWCGPGSRLLGRIRRTDAKLILIRIRNTVLLCSSVVDPEWFFF